MAAQAAKESFVRRIAWLERVESMRECEEQGLMSATLSYSVQIRF